MVYNATCACGIKCRCVKWLGEAKIMCNAKWYKWEDTREKKPRGVNVRGQNHLSKKGPMGVWKKDERKISRNIEKWKGKWKSRTRQSWMKKSPETHTPKTRCVSEFFSAIARQDFLFWYRSFPDQELWFRTEMFQVVNRERTLCFNFKCSWFRMRNNSWKKSFGSTRSPRTEALAIDG